MVYEHDSENLKPDNSIVNRIEVIMSKLVDNSGQNDMSVKQESAQQFTQLVTLLRKLDKKRMRPIMEKYFNCEKSGMCKPDSDLKNVYRLVIIINFCKHETSSLNNSKLELLLRRKSNYSRC